VNIVTALIASNEFRNLASAYRLWVGDMATAITENLSDVSQGGSISENYHMVPCGWGEMVVTLVKLTFT
jgi:hypothetical protein